MKKKNMTIIWVSILMAALLFLAYYNKESFKGEAGETKSYSLRGQIIDPEKEMGLAGVQVEVWDKIEGIDYLHDTSFDKKRGDTTSDTDGHFSLSFDAGYNQTESPDNKPRLYFKLDLNGEKLSFKGRENGEAIVLYREQEISVVIKVDSPE